MENIATYRNRRTILELFRHKTVVSREEIENAMSGDAMKILRAIQKLESDGLIRLQERDGHPGRGGKKIVGAEITMAGFGYLHNLIGPSPRSTEEPVSLAQGEHIDTKPAAERQPCGVRMKICYMGAKCYLSYKCSAARATTNHEITKSQSL